MSDQELQAYQRLISPARIRPSSVPGRDLYTESESDRARLIFSSPFRRLQQKAQVFSLEDNAAVRSRLTHSFEVSQIGRFVAQQIVADLRRRSLVDLKSAGLSETFGNFVETACLMHDLGNPPFGHFGETAISTWFSTEGRKALRESLSVESEELELPIANKLIRDYAVFDGNCQGLRIATRLQWNLDEFGLNLTCTALASFLKYVCGSDDIVQGNPIKKKAGYFNSERSTVHTIWDTLGMRHRTRHPLTYVMEAADDIAYCVSDIEDAIEKGFFSEREFFTILKSDWKDVSSGTTQSSSDKVSMLLEDSSKEENFAIESSAFTKFRTGMARLLSEQASTTYVDQHEHVLDGTYGPLLDTQSEGASILGLLKRFAVRRIYSDRTIAQTELAGHAAIRGILDHHRCLLTARRERFDAIRAGKSLDSESKPIAVEKKLVSLLPKKYLRSYAHAVASITQSGQDANELEWYYRVQLIVDYISGMTDDFALATYRGLSGIRLRNET